MSKEKQNETKQTEEFLTTEAVMLSGEINSRKPRDKKAVQESRQGLNYLKQMNAPKPKADTKGNKPAKLEEGKGPMDEEDEIALKDYVSNLSKLYNQLHSSSTPARAGKRDANIREWMLDSTIGDIAQQYYGITKQYYSAVANSKSKFYPSAVKQDAKMYLTEIESIFGDMSYGSRARAMKMQFVPAILKMSYAAFPEIDVGSIYDYCELQALQRKYEVIKPYYPWVATNGKQVNYHFDDPLDKRGLCDVNADFDLPFLPITAYFKELLKAKGVSDDMLAALGNYTQEAIDSSKVKGDSNNDLDSGTFTKVCDYYAIPDASFKHWGGPTELTEIQLDLLSWIDSFKLKTTSVLAYDDASTELDGIARNRLSADLAIKIWMSWALNAVFKVIAEDGTGIMKRVELSQIRSMQMGVGAKFYDTAMEVLNVNTSYMAKPIDDCQDFLKARSFRFNPKVYKFLKEAWAPIVKKVDSNEGRFIGESKLPDEGITLTLIPRLVLPCNPYDSMVAKYEENLLSSDKFPEEPKDRSIMFTNVTLPHAYLDQRNNTDMINLTVRVDNLLSYALYACKRSKRFSGHSWKAVPADGTERGSKSDYSKVDWKGPHTVVDDAIAGAGKDTDRRAFFGDLWASALDRTQKLGFQYGIQYASINQMRNVYQNEKSSGGDDAGANGAFLWTLFHTNPWSVRFMSICDWFRTTPCFIARWAHINQQMTRFITGVLDGTTVTASTSIAAAPATMVNCSKACANLSIKDAFRHSVVYAGEETLAIFDNLCGITKPATIVECTGDEKTKPESREIHTFITKVDGKSKINRDSAIKALQEFDGDFNIFKGKELDSISAVGNAICTKTIRKQSIYALLSGEEDYLHDLKDRCLIKNLLVKPPKYTSHKSTAAEFKGLPVFNKPGRIAAFTKNVCVASYQTYYGEAVSETEHGSLDNTWAATIKADIVTWAKAIKAWNAANPDLIHYGASEQEFNAVVDYIFAPFTQIYQDEVSKEDAEKSIKYVRYSNSVCATIGTYYSPASGNSPQDERHFVLDPMVQAVTGIGHVIYDSQYVSFKATKRMMSILGQTVLDSIASAHVNMCEFMPHGITLRLNESKLYLNLRKTLYKSPLPEVIDSDTFNFGLK